MATLLNGHLSGCPARYGDAKKLEIDFFIGN